MVRITKANMIGKPMPIGPTKTMLKMRGKFPSNLMMPTLCMNARFEALTGQMKNIIPATAMGR